MLWSKGLKVALLLQKLEALLKIDLDIVGYCVNNKKVQQK